MAPRDFSHPWPNCSATIRASLLPVLVVTFLYFMGSTPAAFLAFKYLQDVHHWSPAMVSSLVHPRRRAGQSSGNIVAGRLSDRLGRRTMTAGFTFTAPLLMLLFLHTGGAVMIAALDCPTVLRYRVHHAAQYLWCGVVPDWAALHRNQHRDRGRNPGRRIGIVDGVATVRIHRLALDRGLTAHHRLDNCTVRRGVMVPGNRRNGVGGNLLAPGWLVTKTAR